VALSTPTPHLAPLFVAKDKRFAEKYGLDVQLIVVNSGSLVAQMFQAREIQITANAPGSLAVSLSPVNGLVLHQASPCASAAARTSA